MEMLHTNQPNGGTKVYYVVDFDRCLGNTDKLYALLEEIIYRDTSITPEQMQHAHADNLKSAGSFNAAEFVQEKLAESDSVESWDKVAKTFIEAARKTNMCEPHAHELLELFEKNQIPYGILTFGGLVWQTTKIKAADLDHVPHMIISTKKKGRVLASWKQADNRFQIPEELGGVKGLLVDSLVLIDDRAISFEGIPDGVRGIYILPYDARELLPSQKGKLPDHVRTVRGLAGAIGLIKSQNSW